MPVLALLVILTISCIPLEQDRHVYSQPSETISTEMVGVKVVQGVDLANIHTSPSNVKVPSKFEITSTVVNNSPSTIMFNAGVCDSPLSVKFIKNVVVKYTQGCTTSSPSFKLKPGEQVSIAGPSSGTIYQAYAAGQTTASVTLHYQTENGTTTTVTKPFTFTISS